MVELLISHGADVNAAAAHLGGRTALQAAAENGDLAMVDTLLGYGADINGAAAEYDGKTALYAATVDGHRSIV